MRPKKLGYRLESYESDDGAAVETAGTSTSQEPRQQDVQVELTETNTGLGLESRMKRERNSTVRDSDCCCAPQCFTTLSAVLGTLMLFLASVILVLVLNFGIREAGIFSRSRPYSEASSPDDADFDPLAVNFLLRGTPSSYLVFEIIPYKHRRHVVTLELDFVDIEIESLVRSLHFCESLETIVLTNVRFSGTMPWTRYNRATLPPKLRSFRLEYNAPIGPNAGLVFDLCDACFGGWEPKRPNISNFLERTCLESFIFIQTPYANSGNILDINFNIDISIWGWTYLKLSNDTRELTSMLPYSNELILNITNSNRFLGGLKKLSLRSVSLKVSTLVSLAGSLEELHLDNVIFLDLHGLRVSQLLTNFSRLEQLTLKFNDYVEPPTDSVDGFKRASSSFNSLPLIHLDDLPTSLKNLTLAHVQLDMDPSSNINFHLDHLNFYRTKFLSSTIVANFSRIFKVNKIGWQCWGRSSDSNEAWNFILNQILMSSPEWVFIDNSFVGKLQYSVELSKSHTLIDIQVYMPFLLSEAFILNPKRSELPSTVADPMELWFKLLNVNKFLNERFAAEPIW